MFSKRFCLLALFQTVVHIFLNAREGDSQPAFKLASLSSYKINLKSLECISMDEKFCQFKDCSIAAGNDSNTKYVSTYTEVYKTPVRTIMVHFKLFRYNRGYNPFIFNFKLDMCKFIAGRKSFLFAYTYDAVKPFTNFNHTCPYNHDIINTRIPIGLMTIPSVVTSGKYCFHLNISANGGQRAFIKAYFGISKIQE